MISFHWKCPSVGNKVGIPEPQLNSENQLAFAAHSRKQGPEITIRVLALRPGTRSPPSKGIVGR